MASENDIPAMSNGPGPFKARAPDGETDLPPH